MKKYKLTYLITSLLFTLLTFSQEGDKKIKKANDLYENLSYIKSIEVYEKVANNGYKSAELLEKLANSYYFNSEYVNANKWYQELFNLPNNTISDPILYYRFSQTLKSVGENEKANYYLKKFSDANSSDYRAVSYKNNSNYLNEIENNSNRYSIEDSGLNSEYSDYGSSIYGDTIIFTSTRTPEKGKSKKDYWTADYFSSMYSTTLNSEKKPTNVSFFYEDLQTKYHESSPVFTKDGNTIYFTRNNYFNNKKKSSSDKTVLLKVYKATKDKNGKWVDIVELPFNNNEYSCAHPMLNSDETKLFFVSNMPGGFGDSDLYYVDIKSNDAYSDPVNLGSNINTQGKETFPFIYNNELYFSSDGHLGLGGLDIFVTKISNTTFTNLIHNVGKPINSPFDDFSYLKLNNSNFGFFTSNREGGKGKDDIYRFNELQKLKLNTIFSGIVVDKENNEPLKNSIVTIYDNLHNEIGKVNTDGKGEFTFENDKKTPLTYFKAESNDYETEEISVPNNAKKIIIALPKSKKQISKGTDLAKYLNIKDILFDFDKFNIRGDAEVNLQKILVVMNQYPEINIIIGSHTDSRGSANYNKKLSENRAKSSLEYLVSKGINRSRLSASGYGENVLLNECKDGIKCSEEEHQVNRRSEFIVN